MGAFDVSGIMRFENQRALLHAGEPIVGQARRLQEAAGSLDASQSRGDGIGNGEDRRHEESLMARSDGTAQDQQMVVEPPRQHYSRM